MSGPWPHQGVTVWPRAAPSPPRLCPRDRDDALGQGEVMWQEHLGGTELGVL